MSLIKLASIKPASAWSTQNTYITDFGFTRAKELNQHFHLYQNFFFCLSNQASFNQTSFSKVAFPKNTPSTQNTDTTDFGCSVTADDVAEIAALTSTASRSFGHGVAHVKVHWLRAAPSRADGRTLRRIRPLSSSFPQGSVSGCECAAHVNTTPDGSCAFNYREMTNSRRADFTVDVSYIARLYGKYKYTQVCTSTFKNTLQLDRQERVSQYSIIFKLEVESWTHKGEIVAALSQTRANNGPGAVCGPLSSLIWPTQLEEKILIVSKS